jgi:hypothetical protein
MRRSVLRLLMLAVPAVVLAAAPARAQDDGPPFDPRAVPATGRQTHDFVPRGWKAAHEARGDLNGDGVPDRVLHLVPVGGWYDPDAITAAPTEHALVILLTEPGGRLRRAGVAPTLLASGVPQWGLDLTIRNGVLIVHQNYGMEQVIDLTHRFRRDPTTGRFLLIGRDQFFYTRPLERDDTQNRSENYLTGVRLVTIGHVRNGEVVRETTQREQIPRTRIFFENVDDTN